MHLLEVYSLACGVKINKPFMVDHYYPLPFEKYITIHNTTKFESRNYDYWPEVIRILRPFLEARGIKIIQVGGYEDPRIPNVDISLLDSTFRQMANIIKNSMLHVGVDSLPVHMASMYDIPIVALYSNVYIENSRPYWSSKEKVRLIEANRNGDKPTFSPVESPKTINNIFPENVAKNVLELLKIKENIEIETIFIGQNYHNFVVEFIPDEILPRGQFQDGVINLRMDLHFSEENLFRTLSTHRINIVTDKPINLKYIEPFKTNVVNFNIEINESITLEYIEEIKRMGIHISLVAYDLKEEEVSKIRFKFFNFKVDLLKRKTPKHLLIANKIRSNTKYKTNKFLLSKGKIYMSKADWLDGKAISSINNNVAKINNNEIFWEELEHFYIFNN